MLLVYSFKADYDQLSTNPMNEQNPKGYRDEKPPSVSAN